VIITETAEDRYAWSVRRIDAVDEWDLVVPGDDADALLPSMWSDFEGVCDVRR
jgi:hypothetical protein